MEKPKLMEATFVFTQEANCLNDSIEQIEIRFQSSLGIDNDDSCFYTIKTDEWSIDNVNDLQELIDRAKKSINAKP